MIQFLSGVIHITRYISLVMNAWSDALFQPKHYQSVVFVSLIPVICSVNYEVMAAAEK